MPNNRRVATGLAALLLNFVIPTSFAADEKLCPLSSPTALLSKEARGVIRHTFQLSSPREATEFAFLQGGESLVISHRGCEYRVLTILINTESESSAASDTRVGYRHAARQLLKVAELTPTNAAFFRTAAKALSSTAEGRALPKYDRPLSLSEVEGMTATVTLVESGRKGAEYHSLIELSRGPF
ncbi:hypothetical protein [Ideonella sp. YS5]|uniref:hypothetical protein n=1 Tax=Ideonella sp. YS5 TaxID=3453714 RepID=UPI003EEBF534